MDIVWISFINLSFVLGLLGFADLCTIRAKLVYGNDVYIFTNNDMYVFTNNDMYVFTNIWANTKDS